MSCSRPAHYLEAVLCLLGRLPGAIHPMNSQAISLHHSSSSLYRAQKIASSKSAATVERKAVQVKQTTSDTSMHSPARPLSSDTNIQSALNAPQRPNKGYFFLFYREKPSLLGQKLILGLCRTFSWWLRSDFTKKSESGFFLAIAAHCVVQYIVACYCHGQSAKIDETTWHWFWSWVKCWLPFELIFLWLWEDSMRASAVE